MGKSTSNKKEITEKKATAKKANLKTEKKATEKKSDPKTEEKATEKKADPKTEEKATEKKADPKTEKKATEKKADPKTEKKAAEKKADLKPWDKGLFDCYSDDKSWCRYTFWAAPCVMYQNAVDMGLNGSYYCLKGWLSCGWLPVYEIRGLARERYGIEGNSIADACCVALCGYFTQVQVANEIRINDDHLVYNCCGCCLAPDYSDKKIIDLKEKLAATKKKPGKKVKKKSAKVVAVKKGMKKTK